MLEVIIQGKLSSQTGNQEGLLLPLDVTFLLEAGFPGVGTCNKAFWRNHADQTAAQGGNTNRRHYKMNSPP